MNPGPLELLGNPLTPQWVKDAIKGAMNCSQLDGLYWANVLLMALRKEAQERELDAAANPLLER